MRLTKVLDTKCDDKYLSRRTVCVPVSVMNSLEDRDNIVINIVTGENTKITVETTGEILKSNSVLKNKDGRKFFVYKY